ncbi:MAG: response regulator transcription factor [Phycisphaerales bacterium]|jgi:two-component system alkaline phosphatase synthesis response regulator PhoP|nr:response regulator transcription factor [Phycisphaerales bacterium]
MARILIADDEADMVTGLRDNLQFEGYDVIVAADGESALKAATTQSPDLVLLDIMMPKMDGLEVCRRIRQAGFMIPILMLTAKGQEIDIVRGLEVGADDYITKPFAVRELLARIKAALRRTSVGKGLSRVMRIGDATVDLVKGKVERGKETHNLGHFELEILKMLVEHAEHPVERNKLLDVIWGLEGFPITRTVDNHIVSLRRKIEPDPKHPQHVVTVHSIGYKFVP